MCCVVVLIYNFSSVLYLYFYLLLTEITYYVIFILFISCFMTEDYSNSEETAPKIFVTFSFKVWETVSSERTNFNVFSFAKSVREPYLHPYVINLNENLDWRLYVVISCTKH